jgi:hypothetical protein
LGGARHALILSGRCVGVKYVVEFDDVLEGHMKARRWTGPTFGDQRLEPWQERRQRANNLFVRLSADVAAIFPRLSRVDAQSTRLLVTAMQDEAIVANR